MEANNYKLTLEGLGFNDNYKSYIQNHDLGRFEIGRIISEHKERYVIKDASNEYQAEIIGNLRFSANSRADFPAIGDWVAFMPYDEHKGLIHHVLPRLSIIQRQAVGKYGEIQIIATNIDIAFIVQAVDRDFNINRLERYLTICNHSKVQAFIILNKIDLIAEQKLKELITAIKRRNATLPILTISNKSMIGINELKSNMERAKTYCLLGSSGVGKSTLLNNLSGLEKMATAGISTSNNKGKHVTSHRELVVLENGSILIDNPGMREVGMTEAKEGFNLTFEKINSLALECKFKDCAHETEVGCAILTAMEEGILNPEHFENYLKLKREEAHFESTSLEKRKKDKAFGKMVKEVLKNKRKNKY